MGKRGLGSGKPQEDGPHLLPGTCILSSKRVPSPTGPKRSPPAGPPAGGSSRCWGPPSLPEAARRVHRAEPHLRQRQELAGGHGVQGTNALDHLQAGSLCNLQEAVAQGDLQALQQHLRCLGQVLLGQRLPPLWAQARAQSGSKGGAGTGGPMGAAVPSGLSLSCCAPRRPPWRPAGCCHGPRCPRPLGPPPDT